MSCGKCQESHSATVYCAAVYCAAAAQATFGHRKMFPTGGRLTVSQLFKSRFPEDKLLRLTRHCQNQRVQTQSRPNPKAEFGTSCMKRLVHRTVYSAAVASGTYVHRRMFSTGRSFTSNWADILCESLATKIPGTTAIRPRSHDPSASCTNGDF